MIHFDKTVFGAVYINDQPHKDILVLGEKIEPRDEVRLEKEIGGHHQIGDFEVEKLLASKPEIIIIGNGQSGVLKVSEVVIEKINKAGVKLLVLETPQAIAEYNRLAGEGKRVNCLMHTTC